MGDDGAAAIVEGVVQNSCIAFHLLLVSFIGLIIIWLYPFCDKFAEKQQHKQRWCTLDRQNLSKLLHFVWTDFAL